MWGAIKIRGLLRRVNVFLVAAALMSHLLLGDRFLFPDYGFNGAWATFLYIFESRSGYMDQLLLVFTKSLPQSGRSVLRPAD